MDGMTAAAEARAATRSKLTATRAALLKDPSEPAQAQKRRRAAARRRLPGRIATGTPTISPSSRKRIPAGVDPSLNNPNDIGAVIIPQGTPAP